MRSTIIIVAVLVVVLGAIILIGNRGGDKNVVQPPEDSGGVEGPLPPETLPPASSGESAVTPPPVAPPPRPSPPPRPTPPPSQPSVTPPPSTPSVVTVSYENNSFNPANLTLKVGDMVKFVNNHSFDIQIESNPHPIHTSMPAFSSDRIPPGGTFEFTFTAPVSFSYHNHFNPGAGGRITVE